MPRNRRAIDCKWHFSVKATSTGMISKFKARLVIKDFAQCPRIDYSETSSPVALPQFTRVLLAIAAYYGYKVRLVDVVGAPVQGLVEEDFRMQQPPGFVDKQRPEARCRLLKALYALKQAKLN